MSFIVMATKVDRGDIKELLYEEENQYILFVTFTAELTG